MNIPKPLLDQIKSGNVILFLGSGASIDALSDNESEIPRGQQLSDAIAKQYLGDSFIGQALQTVSELAISETSLRDVQEFVYNIFIHFKPNEHHKLITDFRWRSIYTTNYDFIIEDAYRQSPESVQALNPIIENTSDKQIILDPDRTVPYFKLHGCLSEINNSDLPLILTPEQYINHKKNRDRLFKRFLEDAKNYPILFVGYSLADIDIRTYLSQIYAELGEHRPRSFMVLPYLHDAELRLWESRKITPILADFKSFLSQLVLALPLEDRQISTVNDTRNDNALFRKYKIIKQVTPTDGLFNALKTDFEFIGDHFSNQGSTAKEFYKGYLHGWDPIVDNLDIARKDLDLVLTEVFLGETVNTENQYLYLIEGFAGSGKSVFGKRLLYEAATKYEKLCFNLREDGVLNYDIIFEIYHLFEQRIYILIDNIHNHDVPVKYLMDKARKDKVPLTIIATERTNIWNSDCKTIYPYLSRSFRITYLSIEEIRDLLTVLELHDSLNHLKGKSQKDREKAFEERAAKELLVALYEATEGKPFETIILDEYNNISDPVAQSLYLTVCIFNRLGTYARAGLISRMHDINFEDFKSKFFEPLEYIVFDERNYRINDYVYKTRHPRIAEIIFEQVLSNPQNRYDEYIRIISELNIDYESDRALFLSITNAQNLIDTIPDPELVRNIYDISEEFNQNEAKLIQQRAIYELKAPGGNVNLSERLIKKASDLEPRNQLILHTQAEIFLAKAKNAKSKVEAYKYLNTCKELSENIIKQFPPNIYPYHTIVKALSLKLQMILEADEEDTATVERLIKDIEKFIQRGNDQFPNHDYLIEAEARFQELLDDSPNALKLLEKAFSINKSSPYLAIRLSNLYNKQGIDISKSIDVVKDALRGKPGDRDLNYQMALFLEQQNPFDYSEILYYLKRAFTMGDGRYMPKFWYARHLYVNGDIQIAKTMFDELKKAKVDPKIKGSAKGYWLDEITGEPKVFFGQIKSILATFAYLKRDIEGDVIFLSRYDEENQDMWNDLKLHDRFSFKIAFSFHGPMAKNIVKVR